MNEKILELSEVLFTELGDELDVDAVTVLNVAYENKDAIANVLRQALEKRRPDATKSVTAMTGSARKGRRLPLTRDHALGVSEFSAAERVKHSRLMIAGSSFKDAAQLVKAQRSP